VTYKNKQIIKNQIISPFEKGSAMYKLDNKKITLQVTPNQAHKFLQKIRGEINSINSTKNIFYGREKEVNLTNFTIKKIDILQCDKERMLQIFKDRFTHEIKPLKYLQELKEDNFAIKEALFAFNATSKVSQMLSEIEILKSKIEYYRNFADTNEASNQKEQLDKIENTITYLKSSENINEIDIALVFYDYDEIKNIIKELNQKILKFESEITILNASNKIDISIHQSTAELLGLG